MGDITVELHSGMTPEEWDRAMAKLEELGFAESLRPAPLAEKKGRWVQYNEMWGLWECSECGAVIHSESKKDRKEYHAFCGRCGARMEGGDAT